MKTIFHACMDILAYLIFGSILLLICTLTSLFVVDMLGLPITYFFVIAALGFIILMIGTVQPVREIIKRFARL